MIKYHSLLLLIFIMIGEISAQNDSADKSSTRTFQNVKTETLSVGGTDFYYRKLGENNSGIPVIFLNHLGATMDNCDPEIMDGIASQHQIFCFDNRGVGATEGKTPKTIAEMATDARAFIHALGFEKVDLIGFSLGGFISQEILLQEPQLVRKAILTGTGTAGGEGIKNVTKITYVDILRGVFSFKDAKTYLFFNRNENGKKSAKAFLSRLNERKENRDQKMKLGNFQAIKQPVLLANGDNDRMVPSSNTYDLSKRISNSEIIVYKDAGHGGIFQYHSAFVKSALTFLAK